MQSLVVFLALAAVARASYLPLAQPAHHPALVLDPHGRPLDTAEVINARALHLQAKALEHSVPLAHAAVAIAPIAHSIAPLAPIAHTVIAPATVSHQSRVDVRTSPAIIAAPAWGAHAVHGLSGHYLKKRSLGHLSYSAPVFAPAAVSHQSRVDVVSSPAVVSHVVAAPVLAHAVAVPAAVSHQSRLDVRTSPAIIAAPTWGVHAASAWGGHASPLLGYSAHGLSGHYLKKRSLGFGHLAYSAPVLAPSAVSHQSRVDVVSSPAIVSHAVAAPVLAHAVAAPVLAPAAVSHQSRVDVRTSPAVVAAPVWGAHAALAGPVLAHSAPLAYSPTLYSHGLHGW